MKFCWHNWLITEDFSNPQAGPGPTSKGDWAAFLLASAIGSLLVGFLVTCMVMIVLGVKTSLGNIWVPLVVGVGLWVITNLIFYSHIWNWRNAGCIKCKGVWLGLTKSQDQVAKWAIEEAKKIRETTELVAKRKEMFRKSRC